MEKKSNSKPSLKERFFNIIPIPALIGIILGAIGGYVYYIEIGCTSGTCPLTSNPYMSIIWGGVIGYLFGDMFRKKVKPRVETDKESEA